MTNQRQSDKRTEQSPNANARSNRLLNRVRRRDVLKATAVAAVSTPVVGSASVGAAESFETITANSDEVLTYSVGSGETFENFLFDVTANNSGVNIQTSGSNWTIRDIGVMGTTDNTNVQQVIMAQDQNSSGSSLIENCYFGDGSVDQGSSVVFTHANHAGTLTIRYVYLRGFEEGLYCSAPGIESVGGQNGVVQIENCYARNNNVQQYRLGTDGSYVQDSVGHVDAPVVEAEGGGYFARGVWGKEGGNIDVTNCDILLEHEDGAYCIYEGDNDECSTINVVDSELDACCGADGVYFNKCGTINTTNVGSNPDVSVPPNVPTTAEEAADGLANNSGGGGGGSSDDVTHEDDAVAIHATHYDTADRAGVQFNMTNESSQELTVTHITVTPQDTNIDELHDEDDGVGRWVSEVHVDADVQSGVCDVGGSAALPNTFDMANDG